ncbi:uncharacterized protein LOC131939990 [Physella acuta]|uniref:uncharacterized protein LOC131939990 n=1 Tax=Physella acuta TaxID=109671 RepID=UPI0027DB465B|nr:uncharacterized protein LOC131939990 [Physella acuta]
MSPLTQQKRYLCLVYVFFFACFVIVLFLGNFNSTLTLKMFDPATKTTEWSFNPFLVTSMPRFWDSWKSENKSDNFGVTYPSALNSTCSVYKLLASVEKSMMSINSKLICDEFAEKSDILCRMFLERIHFSHLETSACALANSTKVPKIVYFVTYGHYTFHLWNYVAFVAAQRHIVPRAIYVIGDQHPVGEFWELIVRDVPNVRFVYREAPLEISGSRIKIKQHHSDIVRLQTIYMNGGIYLDTDMVVLRSLDDLLDNDLTMGMLDNATGLGNAFILAKRHHPFIKEWYEHYRNFKNKDWGYNSMKVSQNMYFNNTNRLVNVRKQLYQPNWYEIEKLVNASHPYNWSQNYAMHMWVNSGRIPKETLAIQADNSTVGQIFRYILYGDPKIRGNV